jgi:hypothetical protein
MVGRIIETEADVAEGAAWLARSEPRFAHALALTGPLPLRRRPDGFATLLSAIVSQQVSTAAASAIWGRVEALGATHPAALAGCSDTDLRACGLSRQKIAYARAIAESGIDFAALRRMPDAEVVAELTRIKGIGIWTAEIYAMFSLGPGGRLRAGRSRAAGGRRAAVRHGRAPARKGPARDEPRLVTLARRRRAPALGLLPGRDQPRGGGLMRTPVERIARAHQKSPHSAIIYNINDLTQCARASTLRSFQPAATSRSGSGQSAMPAAACPVAKAASRSERLPAAISAASAGACRGGCGPRRRRARR